MTDELETLGALFFAMIVSVLMGYGVAILLQEPIIKTVYAEPKPLTYDQQHLLAIDFMVDNPHVRSEICSKRFIVKPMDSDNGGMK